MDAFENEPLTINETNPVFDSTTSLYLKRTIMCNYCVFERGEKIRLGMMDERHINSKTYYSFTGTMFIANFPIKAAWYEIKVVSAVSVNVPTIIFWYFS